MSDQTEGQNEAPIGAAVDKVRHESKKKIQVRQEREDREFFRFMVSSEAGRRFMWSILNEAKPFEARFGAGPTGFPDNLASFYFAGEKDLGLRLYHTWCAKAPAEAMQMLIENDPRFQQVEP